MTIQKTPIFLNISDRIILGFVVLVLKPPNCSYKGMKRVLKRSVSLDFPQCVEF
jgi:hypothetical protein